MSDRSVNATPRPKDALREETLSLAKTAVQALLKARKLSRMYPPGHPGYQQGVEPLLTSLEHFFARGGALVLQVQPNALLWEGHPVYQERSREGNLAFFLYKDGIRSLSFHPGVTREELREFLLVLQADIYVKYGEDDVVTLLWEKDLEHIQYTVVEDWDGDEEALQAAEPKPKPGTPLSQVQAQALSAESPASPSYDALTRTPDYAGLDLSPQPLQGILPLSDEEVQAIKQQILEERRVDRLHRVAEIFLEILHQERGTPDFQETVTLLQKVADQAVLRGDFSVLTMILQNLREMAASPQPYTDQERNALRRVLRTLSSPERFQDIRNRLVASPPDNLDALQAFLESLDTSAVTGVMSLLDLPEMSLRRAVTNALITLGKRNPSALVQGLRDPRWYIVRGVVYVLGRLEWPGAVQALGSVLQHPESRVRVEAIRSLGLIATREAGTLLLRLLDDPDPHVRITAIRYLSNVRDPSVLEALRRRVAQRAFRTLPLEEKRATFETLGELGGESLLPFFREILQRRGWLQHAHPEELRACAVAGLEAVGTPEAWNLIREAQRDRASLVQRASRDALQRRRGGR